MTIRAGQNRANLIRLTAFVAAALLSWGAASLAATEIEKRSVEGVDLSMKAAGYDWVTVAGDGLQVQLSGTAPTEAARFRAVTRAGTVVDSSRVIDLMEVAGSLALKAPDFTIEMLRNDDGIQLIGLIPASTDRKALVDDLKDLLTRGGVTDLLETADYPEPENWERAIAYAVDSLRGLPRAKVSIGADQVAITAITESAAEKSRVETDLTRRKPQAIALVTDISAPRPVITPFTLRFLIDAEGARFDACSADNPVGRDRILQAAKAAGAQGTLGCTLALGAPSQDWADGVVQAIGALARLGKGSVTFTDADIALVLEDGTDPALFDQVVGELESNLPDVFSLKAELLKPAPTAEQGPRDFVAKLTDEGGIELSGRVADDRQRDAIEAYARARFGSERVKLALRVDETLPEGWAVRSLAGLETLGALASGEVHVLPDLVRVTGVSGDEGASDKVARVLGERMGAGARYELGIRYNRRLDPLLGLPDGEECVDRLNNALSRHKFEFEPNKYGISGEPQPVLDALSSAMEQCAEFRIEVGGHTDSQGSEGFNQSLSEGRAKSVLEAMGEAGIPIRHLVSKGYGEAEPVASNETDAGREQNRRIEFRLLDPEPVSAGQDAPAEAALVTGTTGAASAPIPTVPEAVAPSRDNVVPTMPDGPPAAILEQPGSAANPAPELAPNADSATIDGYTVTIAPAGDDTPKPAPRPEEN